MKIEFLHHVSLTVRDLERSRLFYRQILGLREIARPNFSFPGAWFQAGEHQQLHLIVHTNSTFRGDNGGNQSLDTRDSHFAVRVSSYHEALEFLLAQGYREDAADELGKVIANPHAVAGFPQLYILDPDRHIIEINAETPDLAE